MKTVTQARASLAGRSRHGHDPDSIAAAATDLKAAKLAQAIQRAADSAPPLTDEQRIRLASLLLGGAA